MMKYYGGIGSNGPGKMSKAHVVIVAGIGGKQYYDTLSVVAQAVLDTQFRVITEMDLDTIQSYGVSVTPAVLVDGMIMCQGRVPEYDEIRRWICNEGEKKK